jgi:hypothetical protein
MTKRSSADVGYILAGPQNLTAISNKFEYKASKPVEEVTPFGVTQTTFEQSVLKKFEISGYEGWYDDAEYVAAGKLVELTAGANVFMFAPEGNVQGCWAVCAGEVLHIGFSAVQDIGKFHKAGLDVAVSGLMEAAVIIAALVSRAGNLTTEATYVDLGAAGGGTTGGNLYMSCPVLALTGSTNLIISTEDSADHATWAAHTAFTALTAVGAEKKVATDLTMNRYWCIKTVYTGLAGTPSATFTVAVRVNDPH